MGGPQTNGGADDRASAARFSGRSLPKKCSGEPAAGVEVANEDSVRNSPTYATIVGGSWAAHAMGDGESTTAGAVARTDRARRSSYLDGFDADTVPLPPFVSPEDAAGGADVGAP